MFRSLIVLTFVPVYMALASLLGYPVARLQGSPALLYSLARLGIRLAFKVAGTRISLEGVQRLGDTRNTILMANHLSLLDAPVLIEAFDVNWKAVVKKEIFKFPFLNYCLRFAGFIEVDRTDRSQATQAIAKAVSALKEGACFLIFPEGTRSRTGELGEFKKGGFLVAIEARSRIIPLAIRGTRDLMPRGGFRIRPGVVEVRVLDPIDAGRYSYEQRDTLIAEIRSRVAAALAG